MPGITFNDVEDHNFFAYYFANLSDEQKLKLKRDVVDKGHSVTGIDRDWLVDLVMRWHRRTVGNGENASKDAETSSESLSDDL